MSPSKILVIFSVLLIVVSAMVILKVNLQSLPPTPVETAPADPQTRLDGAKKDLERMRLELESADFAEANIADTKARIAEVQNRLDGLEAETAEADPNSETFRFRVQQQQIELQGDLERQIAELDASIADLTRRGVEERQIDNMRAARDLVARRMEALYNDLQLRQLAASRAQNEESPALNEERKALEGKLVDLRKELESWEQQERSSTDARLKTLKDQIVRQEKLVRNLEVEVQATQIHR